MTQPATEHVPASTDPAQPAVEDARPAQRPGWRGTTAAALRAAAGGATAGVPF